MNLVAAWDRWWFAPAPLLRLAALRLLVAWVCLYDAFLYDPGPLLGEVGAERTWNPILVFELLGIGAPDAGVADALATAYPFAVLAVLCGVRTRVACLAVALLAFWQGGLYYSLTKVRHDRVTLCFATFALALSPCGERLSVDAWLRRRRGEAPPGFSEHARWPILLTQATIALGYAAAGFGKLLTPGWLNGYTLQGIMLGHRGPLADVAAANTALCQLASIVAVAAQASAPLCLFFPRAAWVLVPLLVGFHWSTWATMDTGPYMTLWPLLGAFVAWERAPGWLAAGLARRPLRTAAVAAGAALIAAVMLSVMVRVVPLPWLFAALAGTAALVAVERRPLAAPAAAAA